jgi:UDP-glucose 4-epimerase
MSVLVAGGAGYIGSVTAKILADSGRKVVVYDNLSRGHAQAVSPECAFVEGDLGDEMLLRKTFKEHGVESVMHFAAHSQVPESMQKPEIYFENNVAVGLKILEAMRAEGVPRIIFSSTCAVFGVPDSLPIAEDFPKRPVNPYGESKLMFERMLYWYAHTHAMDCTVLRYFNACGAWEDLGEDHDPETHLIPLVLDAALGKRQSISIFGDDYPTPDGTCVRDYIHIKDLALAHLLALEKGGRGYTHYNLGNGVGYSVKEVVEAARRVTGRKIPIIIAPRRPGDPPELVGSSQKINAELGFNAEYPDINQIVESAWAWSREHPEGY